MSTCSRRDSRRSSTGGSAGWNMQRYVEECLLSRYHDSVAGKQVDKDTARCGNNDWIV